MKSNIEQYDYTLEGVIHGLDGRTQTITTEGSRLHGHTTEQSVQCQAYTLGMSYFVWYLNGELKGGAFSTLSEVTSH